MIALITAALQFMVLLFGEIFQSVSEAKQKSQAVDASNEAFQAMVVKVLNRVGQAQYTITRAEDDQVDTELKNFPKG